MSSCLDSSCSQMLSKMLENIHIHSLKVLNFVDIVVPDAEIALVNANSRVTTTENFLYSLPIMLGGKLANFPVFYKNQNVFYD